jgi:tripartite-type tricarboxylate transporter receptor subunit TctC
MRIVAPKLSEMWGQAVVVENQPGANGMIAAANVAKSPPDGYTLTTISPNYVINPSIYSTVPYDTLRDIKPIARMALSEMILVVHPSVPANSLNEFIDLAKSKPGQLNYGSGGGGSATHLATALFGSMSGVTIVHVPYKSVGTALTDLLGGKLEFSFVTASFGVAQVRAGKVRALGIASPERLSQLPGVPTISEAGVAGYDVVAWVGLAGPQGMPDHVVNKIANDTIRALAHKDVVERLDGLGVKVATMPSGEFQRYVVSEHAKWGQAVKQSGAKVE